MSAVLVSEEPGFKKRNFKVWTCRKPWISLESNLKGPAATKEPSFPLDSEESRTVAQETES